MSVFIPETPAGSRFTSRDALVALSLANLLGLRLYAAVLDPSTGYFLDGPRTAATYLGTLSVIVVIALAGIGLAALYRRSRDWQARLLEVLFFSVLALAVHGARVQFEDLANSDFGRRSAREATAVAGALSLTIAALPIRWRVRARRAAATLLLVLSPFAVVTSGQVLAAVWGTYDGAETKAYAVKTPAALRNPGTGPRVVVVVMDELDQFLAFDDRAEGLALPTFDALAAASFHGTRAHAPAMLTEAALPSILTGRIVADAGEAGPSDRLLQFADGSTELFSTAETLLSKATREGHNVALAGWYHPYCRTLGDDVAACSSRSYRPETQGMGFSRVFVRQSFALVESFAHGKKLQRLLGADRMVTATPQNWHVETWRTVHEQAKAVVGDPRYDLVFVHHPLPHPPGIWDPAKSELLIGPRGTYDGNLALADQSLRELLDRIDGSPRGGQTTVVLLADHGKRVKAKAWLPSPRLPPGASRPVPFLVRIPGGAGITSDTPFESIVLHDLVPELLDGRLTTSEAVRDWILARPFPVTAASR